MRGFLLLLLAATTCSAATLVTNANLSGQVWTSNGSPYIVNHDVYLFASHGSSPFTVGPGVEVLVASAAEGSGGLVDTNRVEFYLTGRVFLLGTPEQPIVFRALSNDVASSWYGLFIVNGSGSAFTAFNVTISNAVNAMHFWYARGHYNSIDRITLAKNHVGLLVGGGGGTFSRIHSFNNSTGVVMYGQGSSLTQSLIHDNTHDGVVFGDDFWRQEDSRWDMELNTICANGGAGLRIIGNTWQVLEANIGGCLVASNQFGVLHDFGREREFRIRFCNVTGNAIADYVRAAPGMGCISREPRLTPGFRLRRHSPCIDAGLWTGWTTDFAGQPRLLDDPATRNTGEVSYDGTVCVNDIGAFEYQPRRTNRRKPAEPIARIK